MHDNEENDEIGYDTELMEREKMTLCGKDTNLTHRRRFIYIFLRHVTHYVDSITIDVLKARIAVLYVSEAAVRVNEKFYERLE